MSASLATPSSFASIMCSNRKGWKKITTVITWKFNSREDLQIKRSDGVFSRINTKKYIISISATIFSKTFFVSWKTFRNCLCINSPSIMAIVFMRTLKNILQKYFFYVLCLCWIIWSAKRVVSWIIHWLTKANKIILQKSSNLDLIIWIFL